MARATSKFICQQCSYESPKWMGRCPDCGEWNSLVETTVAPRKSQTRLRKGSAEVKPINLASIKTSRAGRVSTKIGEFDRVLGGGIVPGQVILIAGEPGIGKSTILLQLADKLKNVLYTSGEESAQQLKIRANRLSVKSKTVQIMEETDIDTVIAQAQEAKYLIVDSIQTMTTSDLSGMAGSVGQVRESASRLVRFAKSNQIPVFIVGHVTKQGTVAGPAVLAHIVDSVLWFEGDKSLSLRLLRAVKNRFGPTDEVGIFEMQDKGLIGVSNADKLFLSKTRKLVSGTCVGSIMEGTRPMLVEVQSLVVSTKLAFPKRVAQGVDAKRVELILAILQRRAGLRLNKFDVYVNIVGGLKIKEPSADLAIAMSVASAYFDKPLPKKLLAVGEMGLLGEIREVNGQEKRVREAKRLGFNVLASSQDRYISQAIKKFIK